MAVLLKKGEKTELPDEEIAQNPMMVGLGWDPAPRGEMRIDCDAIALLLGSDGKLATRHDVVYFHQTKHPSGAVEHMGDNYDGGHAGDDELIRIEFSKVPEEYSRIAIFTAIYEAKKNSQHFGIVKNAYIRVFDELKGDVFCRYDLSENCAGYIGMLFGEFRRIGQKWEFNAVGRPLDCGYISEITALYGLDPSVWKK